MPILRVFRLIRILKLVIRANNMEIIYRTLADTAPTLASFLILVLIQLFIFSVVGV